MGVIKRLRSNFYSRPGNCVKRSPIRPVNKGIALLVVSFRGRLTVVQTDSAFHLTFSDSGTPRLFPFVSAPPRKTVGEKAQICDVSGPVDSASKRMLLFSAYHPAPYDSDVGKRKIRDGIRATQLQKVLNCLFVLAFTSASFFTRPYRPSCEMQLSVALANSGQYGTGTPEADAVSQSLNGCTVRIKHLELCLRHRCRSGLQRDFSLHKLQ